MSRFIKHRIEKQKCFIFLIRHYFSIGKNLGINLQLKFNHFLIVKNDIQLMMKSSKIKNFRLRPNAPV